MRGVKFWLQILWLYHTRREDHIVWDNLLDAVGVIFSLVIIFSLDGKLLFLRYTHYIYYIPSLHIVLKIWHQRSMFFFSWTLIESFHIDILAPKHLVMQLLSHMLYINRGKPFSLALHRTIRSFFAILFMSWCGIH